VQTSFTQRKTTMIQEKCSKKRELSRLIGSKYSSNQAGKKMAQHGLKIKTMYQGNTQRSGAGNVVQQI
jgi:hypothetical protein